MSKACYSNHEILTLAVYLMGGKSKPIDTEDVAVKANELAPGRFVWKKYHDQINLEIIRVYLSDAKKVEKGGYLSGSGNDGWMLTESGLAFSEVNITKLPAAELKQEPLTRKERDWRSRERNRLLNSSAYQSFISGNLDQITLTELDWIFRVDTYVTGHIRERKILRLLNSFNDDIDIGPFLKAAAARIREDVDGR